MWHVVKPFFPIRCLPATVAPMFLAPVFLATALLATVFLTTVAQAEEARTLRWKFVAGQTKRYVLDQDMVSEQTSQGRTMKTKVQQTMNVTWRVKSVDDQGVAAVTQTVDRVRMNVQRPREAGPPLAFDSAGKNASDRDSRQLAAHFESLLKRPFGMKIDPLGVVSDIEIPETISKTLKGPEPAPGGDEAFKEMFTASTVQFPAKPLDTGSSWKHTVETKTPLGKQKAITTYTYEGIEKHEGHDLDKIDLKLNVEFAGGESKVKPKIVSQESEGVIYFDGEHGWLARQRTTSNVETELIQGDMKLDETISTTTHIKLVSGDQEVE